MTNTLACLATLLLAALAGAAGSRELLAKPNDAVVGAPSAGGDLGSAAAPGPGAGAPPADVLFTLTAAGATLSADKLVLTGVANTALFSTASRAAGTYSTANFTKTGAGSDFVSRNGRWLDDPVAVLRANATSALVQLASPVYDAASKTVTFQSKILQAGASTQLPTAHGVTQRYVDDAANGVSAGALTSPPAGELTDVALFIDSTSQDLGRAASTKWGGYGWSHNSYGSSGSWGGSGSYGWSHGNSYGNSGWNHGNSYGNSWNHGNSYGWSHGNWGWGWGK